MAVARIRPELFGRVLIQIAPAPPLSAKWKGLSPTIAPGPSILKLTSPEAKGRKAPKWSVVSKTSRLRRNRLSHQFRVVGGGVILNQYDAATFKYSVTIGKWVSL